MKTWNQLTSTEQNYFMLDQQITSTRHAVLLYNWFRSIIERETDYMLECNDGGEISDGTGYQWDIEFENSFHSYTVAGTDPDDRVMAGFDICSGTLNIYSADPDTDEPTMVFEFENKREY